MTMPTVPSLGPTAICSSWTPLLPPERGRKGRLASGPSTPLTRTVSSRVPGRLGVREPLALPGQGDVEVRDGHRPFRRTPWMMTGTCTTQSTRLSLKKLFPSLVKW